VHYQDSHKRLCSALLDFKRAVAVIPSLAIHLDRDVNNKRSINAQTDLPPLLLQVDTGSDAKPPTFRELLATELKQQQPALDVKEVLDYEISLYDVQPAAVIGLNADFIASARLDNLLSCLAGLEALLQRESQNGSDANVLLVCTDHEEVGSATAAGASGPFLESVLRRINEKLGGTNESLQQQLSQSLLVSVDNAHGIHPNFADKHDSKHGPLLNGGPVLKFNANQRYATNGDTSARFRRVCADAGVPLQSFVVRSDMGCGSTIGPLVATELGVATVDIGVPTFAMHSVRELAGARDVDYLIKALTRFYSA
jgi:aspartyl aminopeptidase